MTACGGLRDGGGTLTKWLAHGKHTARRGWRLAVGAALELGPGFGFELAGGLDDAIALYMRSGAFLPQ